jgi:hypothetical protein
MPPNCISEKGHKLQKIKGKEHQLSSLVDGRAQRVEVGDAVLVLDEDLAVNEGSLAGELDAGLDDSAIRSGPVPVMAREGYDPAPIDDDQGAIAVVLNPAVTGGVPAQAWGFP